MMIIKRKLDFYYWSFQCPFNHRILKLLEKYRGKLDISAYDISQDPEKAEKMDMFFPTLTVVDHRYRYFSPLNAGFLNRLCEGLIPEEKPYSAGSGTKEISGTIVPITESNYEKAGSCTGGTCGESCAPKAEFLKALGLPVFGFMNLGKNHDLLGGAEFVPSVRVPYPIPKDEETAFLTCVYLSDPIYDYKSAPLKALENHLRNSYKRVLAISDESGTFPNGDLNFFIRNGYEDQGILSKEPGYCTLHLMAKKL